MPKDNHMEVNTTVSVPLEKEGVPNGKGLTPMIPGHLKIREPPAGVTLTLGSRAKLCHSEAWHDLGTPRRRPMMQPSDRPPQMKVWGTSGLCPSRATQPQQRSMQLPASALPTLMVPTGQDNCWMLGTKNKVQWKNKTVVLTQVELHGALQLNFPDNKARVNCITVALESEATNWVVALRDADAEKLHDFDYFMTVLR